MARYKNNGSIVEAFIFGVDTPPEWFTDIHKEQYSDDRFYGNVILRGENGDIGVCNSDYFEANYEPIAEEI